ncbi:MAG: hypothetical protein ACE5F5_02365 [Acidimicrobiia bacterium]
MYRVSGLVTIVVGALLVFSLAFTPFNVKMDQWEFHPDGSVERLKATCPTPWSIIFEDADMSGLIRTNAQRCQGAARILIAEAFIVAAVALGLGIWGIINGPKPPIRPLEELPTVAAARHRRS